MNQSNSDADQIIEEAEALLDDINSTRESLDDGVMKPISEINLLTDEIEAGFTQKEGELIDMNEQFLSDSERIAAQLTVESDIILNDEEAE